jgi:phage-related protein
MKSIKITELTKTKSFTITGNQIGQLEGWEYPTVISAIDDVPGNNGASYVNSKFGRRRFSYQGLIKGQDWADRITMGLALRQTGLLKKLEFTTLNDLLLQAYVEVLSLDYKYSKQDMAFLIELVAPDPRYYSQTLNDTEFDNSDTKNVTNAGNEITCPSFKLTGSGTYWTLTNNTTGETFSIERTISGTDYIEIDVETHEVLLNGVTSVFGDFSGDFFCLDPGVNSITSSVTGGDGTTAIHVYHRDAYITL